MTLLNLAAYLFLPIEDPDSWVEPIRLHAEEANLLGTVLLGTEGINVTLAGPESSARSFARWLRSSTPFNDLHFKESWSPSAPFRRLRVRVKDEIIRFGQDVHPERERAPAITPLELRRALDEGRDLVLLDARNRHEVDRGTFRGAVSLDIQSFSDLPHALDRLDDAKQSLVVTFCTGGIRCEKSALFMAEQGFEDVRQLEGGLLAYLEENGGAHFDGDLFVFDDRIALDTALEPVDQPQPGPAGRDEDPA